MEGNLLGLNLTVLDFYLVSGEDNWDIFADAGEITVPVGNIFVGDTRCDVKHNDGALALDIVSITQSSELFLPGGIPNIEFDRPSVGVKDKGVDLYTESGNILFFEFSSQVPLNEGSFSNSTVTDEDEFELRHIILSRLFILYYWLVMENREYDRKVSKNGEGEGGAKVDTDTLSMVTTDST